MGVLIRWYKWGYWGGTGGVTEGGIEGVTVGDTGSMLLAVILGGTKGGTGVIQWYGGGYNGC